MSEADKPNNEKNENAPVGATAAGEPNKTETAKPAAEKPSRANKPAEPAAPASTARPAGGADGKGGGKGLALLALLVGLAGLGAGGYALMQQQKLAGIDQRIEQGMSEYRGLPEQTRQLSQRNEQLAARLQPLEQLPSAQSLRERGQLLADLQSQQQQLRERVEQVLGSSREQWRLAEAEYLVRMAMLRLSAMQDVQSAIALLKEADLILRRQDDPGAYAARRQLTTVLESLQTLPQIDRTGLFLQLGALQARASELAALAPEFEVGAASQPQAGQSTWQRWLDEVDRYIRIDLNSDAQVKPLLAGQSLAQVRLALSLALEQAQWAVLNGNAEVYRQSLAQADSLLQSLFSEDNEQAQAMANRLQQLMDRQVEVKLPEVTPALRALQSYLDEREQGGLGAGASEAAQSPADEQAQPRQPTPDSATPPAVPQTQSEQPSPATEQPSEQRSEQPPEQPPEEPAEEPAEEPIEQPTEQPAGQAADAEAEGMRT